jgi:CheY-like chemotaxis protein
MKILLVDDFVLVSNMYKAFLENWGHTSHVAASRRDALNIFKSNDIDLLITDLAMPGMTVYDFYDQIMATKKIPVIILSGSLELISEFVATGRKATTVQKPITVETLFKMVEESKQL